ncbi:MAG: L-histidine N(alpha)-methyltransferase [Wenzhouxiangella sp.]
MTPKQRERFAADVIGGLQCSPKTLPCKYFYDARGSELFEAICQTAEYYVTRADLALHEAHLPEIASCIGPNAHVIEFGSGAGIKTRKLLAALERPRAYTPIEISAAALKRSAKELAQAFPDIEICPLRADYTRPIDAEALAMEPPASRRVVYFPGSTIGNFTADEARDFLIRMGNIAGPKGAVLVGVDLIKPRERLEAAYDDQDGVTAQFNLNLLLRLQNDLGARLNLDDFSHEARFNDEARRIEMHLKAVRNTAIELNEQRFELAAGETIHTENSHKYSVSDFRELAETAGLASTRVWKDPEGLFSMHWLEKEKPPVGTTEG